MPQKIFSMLILFFVSRTRKCSAEPLSITPEGSMDREELKPNPWGSDPPFRGAERCRQQQVGI